MARAASQWAESEMDAAKIQALVDSEKIPKAKFMRWIEAAGQHWPSEEMGQIPVFQAFCECGLRLPAHPFLILVLEYFQVELVNLVPNSITMLGVFVYLCEAYLGISADLELFQYYYGMSRQIGIAGSCGLKLHNGKAKEYIHMFTGRRGRGGRKSSSTGRRPVKTAFPLSGSLLRRFLSRIRLPRILAGSPPTS